MKISHLMITLILCLFALGCEKTNVDVQSMDDGRTPAGTTPPTTEPPTFEPPVLGPSGVGDGIADISKPTVWPSFPWDGKHANASQWNDYAYDAIAAGGLNLVDQNPTDISDYCPNYSNMNETGKAMFWIGMLASMGKYTSSWDPQTEFQEAFNDSTGNPAVSRGIMQIDFERAKNLGCQVNAGTELFDEKKNITCAVLILNHWVGQDKLAASKPGGNGRGGARFWSVLLNDATATPIKALTKSLSFCAE